MKLSLDLNPRASTASTLSDDESSEDLVTKAVEILEEKKIGIYTMSERKR